jgi:hypothetical protein
MRLFFALLKWYSISSFNMLVRGSKQFLMKQTNFCLGVNEQLQLVHLDLWALGCHPMHDCRTRKDNHGFWNDKTRTNQVSINYEIRDCFQFGTTPKRHEDSPMVHIRSPTKFPVQSASAFAIPNLSVLTYSGSSSSSDSW